MEEEDFKKVDRKLWVRHTRNSFSANKIQNEYLADPCDYLNMRKEHEASKTATVARRISVSL